MNTKKLNSMNKMFLLGSFVLGACGPIARDVEEAKVAHAPVQSSVGVSSLETAISGQGKMLIFKYDPSLDWMSDVCQREKASGVFNRVKDTWVAEAQTVVKILGLSLSGDFTQLSLKQALKNFNPQTREELDYKEKALGMADVIRTYDTLINYDCKMSKGYRDRLAYMKTRLLSLGSEQDELYRDKQRIEVKLMRSQKVINDRLTKMIIDHKDGFPQTERFPLRLQAGIDFQRVTAEKAETNYQNNLPTMTQAFILEDGKINVKSDTDGFPIPIQYKCDPTEFKLRDELMIEVEKNYGLKATYRCASSDEYLNPDKYKAQRPQVLRAIKNGVDKIFKEYFKVVTAKSSLDIYLLNFEKWERGERDSISLELCSIKVEETYPTYAEEKVYCDEQLNLNGMRDEVPSDVLKLCYLLGPSDDNRDDPKGVLDRASNEEERNNLRNECIEKENRIQIASKTVELGDQWLRDNSSRPVPGVENIENYFISTQDSEFDFKRLNTSGNYTITVWLTQRTVSGAGFKDVKYTTDTEEKNQVTNFSFNGNSLKFTINLRNPPEGQNVDGEDNAGELNGDRIEFDFDVADIGGVRKIQGDAWFISKDGVRSQGSAKVTLDN